MWELDFLRGLAVLLMCFDHLMFDFANPDWFVDYKKGKSAFVDSARAFACSYWESDIRFFGHYSFVFVFLFLVGVSCAFSRDNVRRGSLLFFVSLAFTGATMVLRYMGIMEDGVVFGILHCISLSILIAAAVDIATQKIKLLNIYLPLVLGVTVCAVGIGVKFWELVVPFDSEFDASHLLGYILGAHAYGDDWFGLFPYVGPVLIGMYFGKAAYSTRVSLIPVLDGKWHKPVSFVGKHALIFYIVHQIALAGLFALMCMCLGYKLAL